MKVKQLIKELLDMDMDADVEIGIQDEDGNYLQVNALMVANYEDGGVGIITPYLRRTDVLKGMES